MAFAFPMTITGNNPYAWLQENAHFYVGPECEADSDSDLTTLTMLGTIGGTLTRAGTTGAITKSEAGITFPGGRYLQLTGLSGTYEGALVVVQLTATSNPAATSNFLMVENSPAAARCYMRMLTGGQIEGVGPNTNTTRANEALGPGEQQTLAFITDPQGRALPSAGQAIYNPDGWPETEAISGTASNISLDTFSVGTNFVGRIQRLAVFLIPPGEGLPDTPLNIWARVAGVPAPVYSSTTMDLLAADGQSLPVGPSISPTEETTYNSLSRYGSKMLAGLQATGAIAVDAHVRPGSLDYLTGVPATGIKPSEVDQNLAAVHVVAGALNRLRGTGSNPILTCNHAVAGEEIADMDNDPATGTANETTIYDNKVYWLDQAAARMAADGYALGRVYQLLIQGTADKSAAPGYWSSIDFWPDHRAAILAEFPGATPVFVLGQSGGDTDTTAVGEDWNVKLDQLALATAEGAILVPEYPFTIADNNVHPGVSETVVMAETFAWAIRRHEMGLPHSLYAPAAVLAGSTITLTYPAWADLTFNDPSKYGGEGIANQGFEVTGATITGVSASGNVVTITTSGGTPTEVRYAMQVQDVSGFAGNEYTAHRGLLRTTTTAVGPVSDATLYQFAPSFVADLT